MGDPVEARPQRPRRSLRGPAEPKHHQLRTARPRYTEDRTVPATAADALGALNRSLRIDPGREWARLCKIYVQFEAGQLVGCLADARLLDRSWFLGSPVEWRVISADEIEFACLVRLGIRTPRLRELYRSIVELAKPEEDDLWPYRPTIFAEAFEAACAAGHFDESEVAAMKAEVTELMTKVDA